MGKHILFLLFFLPAVCSAQIKEQFQEQLRQDSLRHDFESKLVTLNELLKGGEEHLNIDTLQKGTSFSFMNKKTIDGRTVLIFELTWDFKNVYTKLEDAGKINNLKTLRLKGQLKISARGIANEVMDLPKKTNRSQSYNDFYLEIIRKLIQTNKRLLQADNLDYATYQSWEKEARPPTPLAVQQYRKSFILFLYKHYNLN